MNDIKLYEKKVILDKELPVQMMQNIINWKGTYFDPHWHEHVELHYMQKGQGFMRLNQKIVPMEKGSLVIVNSNELHEGIARLPGLDALVLIFEMDAFLDEDSGSQILFRNLVRQDIKIEEIFLALFQEEREKRLGYKIAMKGKIYELITYLIRNYAQENLSTKESAKRKRDLNRLNTVLQYIQEHCAGVITNSELAEMINLSEYRFCHLFKEVMGQSPGNYMIQIRLKKAYRLLQQGEMTIAEISSVTGFSDFNNFGRLFRKFYGVTPSSARKQEMKGDKEVRNEK